MSRVLVLLFAVFLVAGSARAEEEDAEGRAFVEVLAPKRPVYVGEPIRLGLRIGYDRAWFEAHAVPLFRRSMDVPLQVEAPWMKAPVGMRPLEPTADERQCVLPRRSFVLNGEAALGVEMGEIERDGRTLTVLELGARYLPERPGLGLILGARLRFAHATRFQEDFVGGRVPIDRQDASADVAAGPVEVREVPEEGRPPSFQDAVGRFTVRASVTEPGSEGLGVTLVIEGDGNLAFLTPPQTIEGFHVYGLIDDRRSERRSVTYEIAADGPGIMEIPAIPFAFFDPGPPPAYRVVKTQPIPLEDGQRASAGPAPDAPPDADGRSPVALLLLVGSVVIVAVLAMFTVLLKRRRREQARADAERGPSRREAARTALRECLADADADVTDAFAEFLAAHLDVAPATVIDADLETRLTMAGVPTDLAARAAAEMTSLVQDRYANGTVREKARPIGEALIDDLANAFEVAEGS